MIHIVYMRVCIYIVEERLLYFMPLKLFFFFLHIMERGFQLQAYALQVDKTVSRSSFSHFEFNINI